MTGSAVYYDTRVLGGSGTSYNPDEIAHAFCSGCRAWVVGTGPEVLRHQGTHWGAS